MSHMPTLAVQHSAAAPASARRAEAILLARPREWDLLILSVAAYVMTAVGRIHQLFDGLEVLHLAAIAGLSAIALYLFDGTAERRGALVFGPTTAVVTALMCWMLLSIPFSLNTGASFDLVFNNFFKTAIMSFVVAASVRSVGDVERLALVYFAGTV